MDAIVCLICGFQIPIIWELISIKQLLKKIPENGGVREL